VIIDHMGRPDVKIPVESNEYFKRLIDLGASREGVFWKLTSPDRYTRSARPEDWPIVLPFAHTLLQHFPGNVISGTDRPPTEHEHRHPDRQRQSAKQDAQRRRHCELLDLAFRA
jgi:2-pyrone-4,6-dicarboxylate lactonase